MKRLVAVLLLLFPVTAFARPLVSAAHLVADPQKATLELALNAAPDFHVFYLANPYRVVIDMEALDWRAATPSKSGGTALVTGLRYGVQGSGASRLVLDLASPARITGAYYRQDRSGGRLLTINLQQVSAANFATAMQQYRTPQKSTEKTTDNIADMSTAAGGQTTLKASRQTGQEQAGQQRAAAGQESGTNRVSTRKEVYVPPLLTDADAALRSNAAAAQSDPVFYSSPDGYSLSYMHPPGSLIGAGVTVGMQF